MEQILQRNNTATRNTRIDHNNTDITYRDNNMITGDKIFIIFVIISIKR